ncbi:UNVERIFIED_CONTAM: hypothetical protein NCL1_33778 [Trichonephila clavipes]
MCCKGHVFNDTLSNSLLLQCVDGTYWNGTVSPCLKLVFCSTFFFNVCAHISFSAIKEALRSRSNNSEDYDIHEADVVEVYLKKYKYIEEILIPAACVVGLVFGNVAIILLIQKIRNSAFFSRKRKASSSHHNGRSTSVPPSTSSTQVPQTLHVPTTVTVDTNVPPVFPKDTPPTAPPIPPKPRTPQPPIVRQAPRVLMTDL